MRLQERLDVTDGRVDEIEAGLQSVKRIVSSGLDELEDRVGATADILDKRVTTAEAELKSALSTIDALEAELAGVRSELKKLESATEEAQASAAAAKAHADSVSAGAASKLAASAPDSVSAPHPAPAPPKAWGVVLGLVTLSSVATWAYLLNQI